MLEHNVASCASLMPTSNSDLLIVCVRQVKRIHEYKRQLLNVLGIIWRYDSIKKMTPEQRTQVEHSLRCLLSRCLKCVSLNRIAPHVRGPLQAVECRMSYASGTEGIGQRLPNMTA